MRRSRRWRPRLADAGVAMAALLLVLAPLASGADGGPVAPALGSQHDLLAGAAGAPRRPAALIGRELVLEVRLNGEVVDPGAVLRLMPDGTVLVPVEDANRWRLRFHDSLLVDSGGTRFLPLPALTGVRARLDERSATLALEAQPSALTSSTLAIGSGPAPEPSDAGLGAFLNYDLVLQDSTVATSSGAQLRFGLFDGFGALTSDHSLSDDPTAERAVRQLTTLRKDWPAGMSTLRVGDFYSAPSAVGRAALLGGLQWGTNFSLQPSLVTFPFQTLAGEAALPSTVEVYVNGALRNTVDAPPGPFEVAQIPVITGQGTVRMVVTDSLGRSVVVEQPFFASNRLLRAGLHEQSWEVGALREDFGTVSNAYGRAAAVTTHRFGVTDRLTTEFRVEVLAEQQTAGGGIALLAGGHGVLLADAAWSRDETGGRGGRGALGFQGQWGAFTLGAEVEGSEPGFVRIGETTAPSFSTASTTLGWFGERIGSLGLALVQDKPRGGVETQVANLSWSRQVGSGGHLALSFFEDFAPGGRRGASLTWSQAFGARTSASLTAVSEDGADPRFVAQAQRALGREPGWGWRVQADDGEQGSAAVEYQDAYGVYRAGADRSGSDTRTFLGATGGLAWFSGALLPARRIESAFGLVRVPGAPGIGVWFENELIGYTDADGELLLPTLRPYQSNEVRIDAADLPLDAVLAVDRLSGVPYYGSGVVLEFPLRVERSATFTLVRADGRAVPAGATVQVADGPPQPVGEDGFVFAPVPAGTSTVVARWADQACHATVTVPTRGEMMPDLGRIACTAPPPR